MIMMLAAMGMFERPSRKSAPGPVSTFHDWEPLRPDTWWPNFLHGRTKLWICTRCRRLMTISSKQEIEDSFCPGEPQYERRERPRRHD